jgi:chemotaxis protein methyltransferase CheR
MLLSDYMNEHKLSWDARVLATDISEKALAAARKGEYTEECMKSVPSIWKLSYFTKLGDNMWTVSDKLKKEVIFRRFNLIEEAFPFKRKFHVIFCRNVMIYFTEDTKRQLISRFYDAMMPGGYLFIGQSESIDKSVTNFKFVMPSVYKKVV